MSYISGQIARLLLSLPGHMYTELFFASVASRSFICSLSSTKSLNAGVPQGVRTGFSSLPGWTHWSSMYGTLHVDDQQIYISSWNLFSELQILAFRTQLASKAFGGKIRKRCPFLIKKIFIYYDTTQTTIREGLFTTSLYSPKEVIMSGSELGKKE